MSLNGIGIVVIDGSSYDNYNKGHFDPILVWLMDRIGCRYISVLTIRLSSYGYFLQSIIIKLHIESKWEIAKFLNLALFDS